MSKADARILARRKIKRAMVLRDLATETRNPHLFHDITALRNEAERLMNYART